ncbi:uncharacterized protein LOC115738717 [Rhodamnia argentea]|uniref:Uncharacterized protein LOC115738717 n=1 Tax=Rhodamnia argentea TaxID=178133 RepID=A0A8B8P034_9MYRT|nr:uncharacterized protein LOC115738717 [Rhodamnia argentea]
MDSVSPHEFDVVKAEKAKAMCRYQRTRKLRILAHALELLLVLVLLSWYYSGLSAAAGCFLRRLAGLLVKPLVVFLISNGIIVVIVFLARKNDDRRHGPEQHRIYDEYLSARRASGGGGSSGMVAAPEETHVDKQIVPYETPLPPEKIIKEVPLPVPESNPPPMTADPVVEKGAGEEHVVRPAAAAAAAAAENRYRRTRSEVTGEEEPRAELCRSATDNGRPKPLRGEGKPSSVEDLSNEEFNLTVEKYIAKTKWHLREEIMAEDAVLSCHSVAVN